MTDIKHTKQNEGNTGRSEDEEGESSEWKETERNERIFVKKFRKDLNNVDNVNKNAVLH